MSSARCAGFSTPRGEKLASLEANGPLPTAEAVHAARQRRDQAWQTIRRARIEGDGTATLDASLPDVFETSIREADRLADRRLEDAERVALHASAGAEAAQHTDALRECATVRDQAHARVASAMADWHALWLPCGAVPPPPEAVDAWLTQRNAVLATLAREEEAASAVALVTRRRNIARTTLRQFVEAAEERLTPALALAEARSTTMEAALRSAQEAILAKRQARASQDKQAAALIEAKRQLSAWNEPWPSLVAAVHLPAGMQPADAEAALAEWTAIDAAADQWASERGRVADMDALVHAFAEETAVLVARVAPDLAPNPSSLPEIMARLATARQHAAENARLAAEIAKANQDTAALRERRDAAASELAALCTLAGVADETGLPDAIARADRHQSLRATVVRSEDALRRDGDGEDLASLVADGTTMDPEAGRVRVADIDTQIEGLQSTIQHTVSALALATAELDRMARGNDAAEAQQRMEDGAQAARDVAARYARLRLAADLLQAGLARFREEQQAPLLRRAGEHFSTLTLGRYARLEEVDAEGGRRAVSAVRDTGHRCPVSALSEGTLDQLYLSLRLAAIEAHAATADPFPLIADDLLVHFDDARTLAGLEVLAALGRTTQVILFTHHAHIAAMVTSDIGTVQHLPAP